MDWSPPPPVVAGSLDVGTASYAIPGGTVLYVSPDGNDSNAGTLALPKRTLGSAISAAPTGATIVLRTGEYHESVTVPATKVLTIQAYPNEAVWFDGSSRYLAWSGSGPWSASMGFSWTPISSSGYPQVGDGFANLPEQVWIDDVPQTQIADGATPGAGQFSVNRTTGMLSIGTNPENKDVRIATLRRWMLATGPVTLRGFGVRRYSPSSMEGPDSAMIYVAGSSYYSVIENMIFRDSGMHGMAIIRPIALNRITVEECSNAGIQMTTANGSTLSRFVLRNCNRGGWHPQPITAGIKITRTDGIVIRDGIVDHIHNAIGVWFDVSNTRFIVANVSVNDTQVALESELSGGGFYDGVQHHSWFVNCRTTNSQDWAIKVMDTDYLTVANCELDAARVSINCQQDERENTGTAGNLTFEIVPWVTVHNRLLNNRVTGSPSVASIIAYHDPASPVRDPDGGSDRILLGWHFFDQVAGNWVPTAPPGSMIQLGKVDGFRNSYNTWALAASSPAMVGGPPGTKLGTNHQGSTTPANTIAVPLPDDIADLLGIPHGHQQVGPILSAPVLTLEEEPPMSLIQWLCNNTNGVTVTTGNCLAETGQAASTVALGGSVIEYSSTTPHQGSTGIRCQGSGSATQTFRLPFAGTSSNQGAISFYHRSASLPAAFTDIANVRHSGGQLFRIGISTAGALTIRTTVPATIVATANGRWAINRWNRIEVECDNSGGTSAGVVTARIYDGDSTTPLETITSSTANLGTAALASIDFGTPSNSTSTWSHYYDSIQMNDGTTTPIGPYVVPARTADFTGSGSLTAAQAVAVVATFSGSGTLSALSAPVEIREAEFSGSGTLSIAQGFTESRIADFNGIGTLSAVALPGLVQIPVHFSGIGTLNATAEVMYEEFPVFIPPVEKFYVSSTHPLYRLVPLWMGITVLKIDGTYRQYSDEVDPADIDIAEEIYLGGHEYTITDDQALELESAGYGAYITYPEE